MNEAFTFHFHTKNDTPISIAVRSHDEDGISRYYALTLGMPMRSATLFLTPEFGRRLAAELAGLEMREIVERELDDTPTCP